MGTVSNSLFVANPLWDDFSRVMENFLQEKGLVKDGTNIKTNREEFKKLWKEALQSVPNSEKIPGRCGGSGASVMIPFAKLNPSCSIALIGRIGKDSHGEKIKSHLRSLKVDSKLIEDENLPTGNVKSLITPGARTMIGDYGATINLNPNDFDENALKGFDHWHLEGYLFLYPGVVAKCIAIATKNKETILSLNLPTKDIIQIPHVQEEMNKQVDKFTYIFGTKDEIMALKGAKSLEEAFTLFSGTQTVAATDGENGCWVKAKGKDPEYIEVLPVPIKAVINKTGSGDIWAGTYLALAVQGKTVQTSAKMANKIAAEWIKLEPGTTISEETWSNFRNKIATKV